MCGLHRTLRAARLCAMSFKPAHFPAEETAAQQRAWLAGLCHALAFGGGASLWLAVPPGACWMRGGKRRGEGPLSGEEQRCPQAFRASGPLYPQLLPYFAPRGWRSRALLTLRPQLSGQPLSAALLKGQAGGMRCSLFCGSLLHPQAAPAAHTFAYLPPGVSRTLSWQSTC